MTARDFSWKQDSWIPISILYVFAMSILIMGSGTYNPGLRNSMMIRALGFVGRAMVFSQGDKKQDNLVRTASGTLAQVLESFAGEKVMYERDRIEAGALALLANTPQLVPLFINGPMLNGKAASSLVALSFADYQDVNLKSIAASSLPRYLVSWVEARVYEATGDVHQAKAVLASARDQASTLIALTELGFILVFIMGMLGMYFLLAGKAFGPVTPKKGGFGSPRAVAGVFAIFASVLVTVKVFGSAVLARYMSLAQASAFGYLLILAAGLLAVKYMGPTLPSDNLLNMLGFQDITWPKARVLVQGLCTALAAVFIGTVLGSGLVGNNGLDNTAALIIQSSKSDVIILVILAVVIAPVFEEALFRGFIFRRLRANYSTWGAAWLSGAIFAFAHMEPGKFIPLTVLGYVFARLYEKTGNLLTTILMHAVWNLGMLFVMLSLFYR